MWNICRIDNRIFRRPNNRSMAVQTDETIHPFLHGNVNNNNVSSTEQLHHELIVERCTQNNYESVDKSNTSNNTRHNSNNYRIPKKNPFARHVNSNEPANVINVRSTEKLEDPQIISDHQSKRYHLPKKNPFARCLDVGEEKCNLTHGSRVARIENAGERNKSKDRRSDIKDNRQLSPARHRSHKKSSSSDGPRRQRDRKHSRGRSSSDDRNRFV